MTQAKQLFKEIDRESVESLVYDPSLEPNYNALAGHLMWFDELPSHITSAGIDVLSSLWVARSLMHRGLTFSDHPVNPEYSQRVWKQAIQEIPNWPGFQRLKLSVEDQKYYAEMLEKNHFA